MCIFRSDAVSPQAADVIDNDLSKVKQPIDVQYDSGFSSEKQIENGNDERKEYSGLKKSIQNRAEEEKSRENYHHYSGTHSSDIESDPDKDEHSPESPSNGYSDNRSFDYQQRLASNLNPFSAFGAEEARLRFGLESAQFKERLNAIGIPPFGDEELQRRYSLKDNSKSSDSPSKPTSPDSRSLQGSPVDSYKGSRSINDISFEDQDTNSFLPNVKEGLFFCHLCSFSGKFFCFYICIICLSPLLMG